MAPTTSANPAAKGESVGNTQTGAVGTITPRPAKEKSPPWIDRLVHQPRAMMTSSPLYQVAEVPVHRLLLLLVWLRDRSEHHGYCDHVLPETEEILCVITAFSE
jgi:hypothetical protein